MNKRFLPLAIIATLGLSMAAFVSTSAFAQDPDDEEDETLYLEEVIVTGSAIRRGDLENTLPIQIISQEMIQASGVLTATELIAKVPAMQNYFTPADSVGGGGGGLLTANLRGIGPQYTLVLLNGKRIAPADSGSTIDLSGIPLAAIERVEILTDGASALYGADAIAGVVNFIMKDSVDGTTIQARYSLPEESGGEAWNASIVTGFGDIHSDGYSFVFTYNHTEQEALASADRDFAETGFIFFNHGGQDLYFQNSSANVIPGNAYLYDHEFEDGIEVGPGLFGLNPYAESNGSCAERTTPDGRTCRMDYTSLLEILPENKSDSMYLSGAFMATDQMKLYATALVSSGKLTARIAPYPSGEFTLQSPGETSPLVAAFVYPHLTPEQIAETGYVTATWRAIPAGNRTTEYDSQKWNLTLGMEGTAGDFDYNASYTHTQNDVDQNYPTGWLLLDEFTTAAAAGAFNVFAPLEDFTEADQEALAPTIYHGNWDNVTVKMDVLQGVGSMPMFDMSGGDAMIAFGADYRNSSYDRKVAEANTNELLLFLSKDTPYKLERPQWGVFTETLFPFSSSFEATASLRYDDVSAVKDKLNGGSIDEGDTGVTYKVSAKWDATDWLTFRGSYGTGFKAPSMREIGEPLSEFGVTTGTFDCPFGSSDPLAQYCLPQEAQYDVFRQGFAGLEFETSTQYTVGFVMTPASNFDITIDYWVIELEDLVERLTESQIFGDPVLYRDLYTTKTNLATGQERLAIIQAAVNVGTGDNEGIDYNFHYAWDASFGQWDFNLRGTHMLDSVSSLTGSSLGKFGNDDAVVFEDMFLFSTGLSMGNWHHTLLWNYRSGYDDQEQTVEIVGTGVPLGQGPETDVQLKIGSYQTWDYQVRWMTLEDRLGLSFGIQNFLDEEPPLSLRVSGAGHQVGWDPRYTDAFGRTYYVSADFTF
jgi:iron complex outermembrane receptor protein